MSKINQELYERCINLAMRMLETEYRSNYAVTDSYQNLKFKYQEKDVIALSDRLYKKIKAVK